MNMKSEKREQDPELGRRENGARGGESVREMDNGVQYKEGSCIVWAIARSLCCHEKGTAKSFSGMESS
jgi:hypothetical protein